MPEVIRSSPVREENEAQHEHHHEEIVLSDHDALLLLSSITNRCLSLLSENDVTEGTFASDSGHK